MRHSNRELDETEAKVLDCVESKPGLTLLEISEQTGLGKYDVYQAVKKLRAKGLVKVVEGPNFDPYSPSMTREVLPTKPRLKVSKRAREPKERPVTTGAVLVATHPKPSSSTVDYVSFIDAFEALVNESEVVRGITGYLDPNAFRRLCTYVTQRCKKGFEVKLVCGEIKNEAYLGDSLSTLERRGVKAEIRVIERNEDRSILHAKFFVSGDLVYVGSHNITEQALTSNLEVGVLLRDGSFADTLLNVFNEFWKI